MVRLFFFTEKNPLFRKNWMTFIFSSGGTSFNVIIFEIIIKRRIFKWNALIISMFFFLFHGFLLLWKFSISTFFYTTRNNVFRLFTTVQCVSHIFQDNSTRCHPHTEPTPKRRFTGSNGHFLHLFIILPYYYIWTPAFMRSGIILIVHDLSLTSSL